MNKKGKNFLLEGGHFPHPSPEDLGTDNKRSNQLSSSKKKRKKKKRKRGQTPRNHKPKPAQVQETLNFLSSEEQIGSFVPPQSIGAADDFNPNVFERPRSQVSREVTISNTSILKHQAKARRGCCAPLMARSPSKAQAPKH